MTIIVCIRVNYDLKVCQQYFSIFRSTSHQEMLETGKNPPKYEDVVLSRYNIVGPSNIHVK